MLATLGFGEHYLVDLVVAVPFALALQAVWTRGLPWNAPERLYAFMGGSLAVALWLVLLRVGAPLFRPSPALAWAAVGLTVLPSLLAHHKCLARSIQAHTSVLVHHSPTHPLYGFLPDRPPPPLLVTDLPAAFQIRMKIPLQPRSHGRIRYRYVHFIIQTERARI